MYVVYASLIGLTLAGLKAYETGWAPVQRTGSMRCDDAHIIL